MAKTVEVEPTVQALAFDPELFGETQLDLPSETGIEQWSEFGDRLFTLGKGYQWWMGDWLVFGDRAFGQEMVQALDTRGISTSTYNVWMWVADRIGKDERRPALSWSHHKAVAGLDRKGDRKKILARAERDALSEAEVRALVDEINGKGNEDEEPPPPKPKNTVTCRVSFTVPTDDKNTALIVLATAEEAIKADLEDRAIVVTNLVHAVS